MSVERLLCKNLECKNTILPATAAANDGLCAPCLGRIEAAKEEAYLRENRRMVDLYDGVIDPVEAIAIMLAPRKYDPLIRYAPAPWTVEELFGKLTEEQARRLANMGAQAMREGNSDYAEDIGKSLATLTPYNLDSMLHAWLDMGETWPAVAFRGAGAAIRDRVLQSFDTEDGTLNVNHALSALAWIGDETVQRRFAEWEAQPPAWREQLYVGPAEYARTAGWEPAASGRRDLFHETCFGLVRAADGEQHAAVRLMAPTSQFCPWCGDQLVHLLEIPTRDEAFRFVGYAGDMLPVLTCGRCTCWSGYVFARIAGNGIASWHPKNPAEAPTHLYRGEMDLEPWQGTAVVLKPRPAIYATEWGMEPASTQIGGLPCWVQDAAYPMCPDCDATMMYLGEVNNGDLGAYEGTYYAFWCPPCRNTATCYQQT
jgi:hypothetical protein